MENARSDETPAAGSNVPVAVESSGVSADPVTRFVGGMHDAVCLFDPEWRFRFVNEAAERLLGMKVGDVAGRLLWDVFPKHSGAIRDRLTSLSDGRSAESVVYFEQRDLWLDIRAYPSPAGVAVLFLEAGDRLERKRMRAALGRISSLIHSTLDTDEIMRNVVTMAAEGMGCESASISLLDGDLWWPRYVHNMPGISADTRRTDAEFPLAAEVRRRRAHVVVEDTETAPAEAREAEAADEIMAALGLPLIVRGELIGVMGLYYHSTPWHFTDGQLQFAEGLSAELSLALSNSALFERTQRSSALNKTLSVINELLLTTLDADELMERVVEEATLALGADVGMVLCPEGSDYVLRYAYGAGVEKAEGHRWPRPDLPGFSAVELTGQPMIISDSNADVRVNAAFGREFGLKSFYELPMQVEGEVIGLLCFAYRERQQFGSTHLDFAMSLTDALSLALQNTRIFAREHRIANTLQRALLEMPHRVPGIEFAHAYRSASMAALVGGDFYDVYELDGDSVGVTIGDVSGKGLEAAALTSLVKNTVRAYAEEGRTPEQVVQRTNTRLVRETPVETFVTLMVGRIDLRDGSFTYCNAGHPRVMLISPERFPAVRALPVTSPVAGAFLEARFTRSRVELAANDALLMYTDGVLEVRDENHELYGEDRVLELAAREPGTPVSELVETLCMDVLTYGQGSLSDDLAVLALRFAGPTGPSQVCMDWEV